jgi:hypothetical protein
MVVIDDCADDVSIEDEVVSEQEIDATVVLRTSVVLVGKVGLATVSVAGEERSAVKDLTTDG